MILSVKLDRKTTRRETDSTTLTTLARKIPSKNNFDMLTL